MGILLAPFLLQVSMPGYGQGNAVLGTTQIHPGGHYGVYNTTNFVSGYLVTPRNLPGDNVLFNAGSGHTGSSNSSHVNGYVEKVGNTAFNFPTGNGTKLRTVGISAPASGSFRAAYWSVSPGVATLPTGAPFPTSNVGTGVVAVSNKEYWDVDGASAVSVTLTWDAASKADSLASQVATNLVVVGYNPTTSKWENLGNAGGVAGTLTGAGSVTANNVVPNTYSAFTIGAIADQTDTDEDGTPDITDTDDDNDGLLDTQDPKPKDTDNDGTDNATDTDDDGDGIADNQEAAGQKLDTDNDGTPNVTDTDDDGDGIPDSTEQGVLGPDGKYTLPDTDGDGLPDLADGIDTDEDGIPDSTDTDDDNDGIPDTQDPKPKDTDNDGTDNAADTDDDGDGIADNQEAAGQKLDTDNDGTPNVTDTDDDNDGIPDSTEQGVLGPDGKYTLPDTDNDGLPDLADAADTDEDGIPDSTDPDDDNDGLPDTQDPKPKDTDNDGIDNATDTDDDGDGIADNQEAAGQKLDTDNDGTPNVTDTDDDGDGIPDSTEQGVLGPDGKYTLPDTDGDGLPDLADAEDQINLTPIMLMPSPDLTNATPTKNFEIKIYNLGKAASTGTVTLYVIKPTPNFTMTFTGGGWSVTDSGNFYTLTNNGVSVPAQMGTPPTISGSVTKGAGVAKGIYNLQVVIADNSGGEKNNTDNSANVTLNVNP